MRALGRDESESYAVIKSGLARDTRSHVAWLIYGQAYRSDGKYDMAVKCFRNSLKIEPSQVVERDITMLQIHTRGKFSEPVRCMWIE